MSRRLNSILSQLKPANSTLVVPKATAVTRLKKPVRVLVTGASGNIGYAIVFMIAQGYMLGPDQPIDMVLLDIPVMEVALKGLVMELQDGAFPLLHSVIATSDYKVAFKNIEIAMLVGARPRGPGMQRKDLLKANAAIFAGQGKALNAYASRNVKVLVVGNPANTNALIAMTNAPDIPKTNFAAMVRLDQNRASSLIAARLKVDVSQVKNVVIWGNHSSTMYPDINEGIILDYPKRGYITPVRTAINDDKWLKTTFLHTIQERGAAIIKARGKSSAASAANAACDTMRSWFLGTPKGEYTSLAVYSDGSYGAPEGVIYGFPVVCSGGEYHIVKGIPRDEYSKQMMKKTSQELEEERSQAL
eukprot:TRINITY_DN1701_c0_g1_i1.p1 TRINITY_DN1701_c0_g1~~TRINITY_DN1701_c0_g1_i1.p1  ORF type:complete len:360 (-),score=100.24 TRINITY_DN1701_c0_g1_i1:1043-2122(-)